MSKPNLPAPACISYEGGRFGSNFQMYRTSEDAKAWADYYTATDTDGDQEYRVESKGTGFRVVAYEADGYCVGPL